MKYKGTYAKEFCIRGLVAMGFGPIVLAIIYFILNTSGIVEQVSVNEMVKGIFTISILAFLVGGINVIYQIEELAISKAITIHGLLLYLCYIAVYIINGWIKEGIIPILVFTGIFIIGYTLTWIVIYLLTKRKADMVNKKLK